MVVMVNHYGNFNHNWLVVDLPLWKISVRQLGRWHSRYDGKVITFHGSKPPTSFYIFLWCMVSLNIYVLDQGWDGDSISPIRIGIWIHQPNMSMRPSKSRNGRPQQHIRTSKKLIDGRSGLKNLDFQPWQFQCLGTHFVLRDVLMISMVMSMLRKQRSSVFWT